MKTKTVKLCQPEHHLDSSWPENEAICDLADGHMSGYKIRR